MYVNIFLQNQYYVQQTVTTFTTALSNPFARVSFSTGCVALKELWNAGPVII